MGLNPENAPGTRLYSHYEPDPETYVEIAGVMKDFNYNSLHDEVKPFMLVYNPDRKISHNLTVAANSKNYKELAGKNRNNMAQRFAGVHLSNMLFLMMKSKTI